MVNIAQEVHELFGKGFSQIIDAKTVKFTGSQIRWLIKNKDAIDSDDFSTLILRFLDRKVPLAPSTGFEGNIKY